MKILGIDTSGYANAVGITDGGQILADAVFPARMDSLEKILANIDSTLKDAGLGLEDIEGIGVGLGPGSWTGIRVGVTVGKILAYSTGKPVAGIATLDALAFNAGHTKDAIYAIIDAGTRDTVYAARYQRQKDSIHRVGDYYVGAIQELPDIIKESGVIIGAEAESYYAAMNRIIDASIKLKAIAANPRGASVALLAAACLEKGKSDDPMTITPLYLKESTAKALQQQ
ncbi:tRNA (adenosine(37)-N6)-threonylcarbamoyltransferase complex dimerization subunit type 1 TsaB, partial [Chloroflexota bacterium]